jgi:hypothetical protein
MHERTFEHMRKSKLTKTLGLAVLAVTAIMAMNASAAQAVYKLEGGTETAGVLLLHLVTTFGLGEILIGTQVGGLNIHVHCPEGTGLVHLVTNAAMTTLTGSGTADFKGCTVKSFPKCTVFSPGAAAGLIAASGSGAASMSGTETFAQLSSANFSEFEFGGALCPFLGLSGQVSGEVRLGLGGGEANEVTHTATLDDIPGTLAYGGEPSALHGLTLTAAIAGTVKKSAGGSWGIHL